MVAYPLTKGKTLRHILNTVLHNRAWVVEHETKKWSDTAPSTVALVVQVWLDLSVQLPDHQEHAVKSRSSMSSSRTNKTWFRPIPSSDHLQELSETLMVLWEGVDSFLAGRCMGDAGFF
eukprot:12932267-Prorocentrum_lima.AAC.1